MSNKQKVRVVAPMPIVKQRLRYLFIVPAIILMLFGGYYTIDRFTAPKIAEPMKGSCVEAPVRNYGNEDKNARICKWMGWQYGCVYDPNKNSWYCTAIDPPAEAKK